MEGVSKSFQIDLLPKIGEAALMKQLRMTGRPRRQDWGHQ